jgi:hypothetical protein
MRVSHLGLCLILAACGPSAAIKRPDSQTRSVQTSAMHENISGLGRNGDWLVVRGYKVADELVVSVTNTPISHAAILDLDHDRVIESNAKGVHANPLRDFLDKVHRVILIRPVWAEGGAGETAVSRARKLIGKKYDFTGLVGVDNPERYYCSELAIRIYKEFQTKEHQVPLIIEPGHLYLWGTILYDSRPRHWK